MIEGLKIPGTTGVRVSYGGMVYTTTSDIYLTDEPDEFWRQPIRMWAHCAAETDNGGNDCNLRTAHWTVPYSELRKWSDAQDWQSYFSSVEGSCNPDKVLCRRNSHYEWLTICLRDKLSHCQTHKLLDYWEELQTGVIPARIREYIDEFCNSGCEGDKAELHELEGYARDLFTCEYVRYMLLCRLYDLDSAAFRCWKSRPNDNPRDIFRRGWYTRVRRSQQ